MADATIWEWSGIPDSNANLSGMVMYEGMAPALLNNGIRAMMASLFTALVSVSVGLSAGATGAFVDATPLPSRLNVVSTVAAAARATKLLARPVATAYGVTQIVFNAGANSMAVFPGAVTDTIDGGAAGASVPLAAGKRCMYFMVSPGVWISAQLGVISA